MSGVYVGLAGAVLGAAGSVGGAYLSRPEGVDFPSLGDLPASGGVLPYGDPLYGQSAINLLNIMGASTRGIELTSSPSQLMYQNFIQTPNVTNEHAAGARKRLGKFQQLVANASDASQATIDAIVAEIDGSPLGSTQGWRKLVTGGGYRTTADLVKAELQWQQTTAAQRTAMEALQPQLAKARQDAYGKIANIMSDYPTFTASDIDRITEAERQKEREALLQQANVGGYNPGSGLSEIEKSNGPMERALQLLGGQQTLSNNSLVTLIQSILTPGESARALSELGLRSSQSNFSNAAQQAAILSNSANNQAQYNLNSGGTLGTGLSAGLGGLSDTLQTYSLINKLTTNQNTAQPGSVRPSTQYSQPGVTKPAGSGSRNIDILSLFGVT